VTDNDQVIDFGEGLKHGLGEAEGTSRLVLQRQIHRRCVVSTRLEFW
jgi:hypothetical protein